MNISLFSFSFQGIIKIKLLGLFHSICITVFDLNRFSSTYLALFILYCSNYPRLRSYVLSYFYQQKMLYFYVIPYSLKIKNKLHFSFSGSLDKCTVFLSSAGENSTCSFKNTYFPLLQNYSSQPTPLVVRNKIKNI